MAVIVELTIVPLGVGVSLSKFLAPALNTLEAFKVRYEVTPMCTVFEAKDIDEALEIAKAAHEAVFKEKEGVKRVVTTIKIDDRRDIERGMEDKVESLRKAIKKSCKS